jgi:CheY-like chemotaxis protein
MRGAAIPEPAAERCRVLVAEDHDEMRALIVLALRADGYEVVEARDGIELLAHLLLAEDGREIRGLVASELQSGEEDAVIPATALCHAPFAAIVSDVRMPGLSGMTVLALLHCAQQPTPVVLITAFGDADMRAEALMLGARVVISKPFEMDDLRRAVRRAVEGSAQAKTA